MRLAACAVLATMLAGCSALSSSDSLGPPPPASSSDNPGPLPTDSGGGTVSGTVTGTVAWHDGHAAANASVFFFNYDPGFTADGWYSGKYKVNSVAADGSYSLPGCPCADLTAYLYVPGTNGLDPANGGQACWIIMQDDGGTYQGLPASPGDVVNWTALDLPCSSQWYTSDTSTVQSEASILAPGNGGAFSGYWQDAENRVSGTSAS
jgi:hypothetical protein